MNIDESLSYVERIFAIFNLLTQALFLFRKGEKMKNGKDWMDWITINITVDQILCKGPCFIKHICLSAGTGGAATTGVHDGIDANARRGLYLTAITSAHFTDDFSIPVYFSKGLFVDIGSNVASFVIQYRPCQEI